MCLGSIFVSARWSFVLNRVCVCSDVFEVDARLRLCGGGGFGILGRWGVEWVVFGGYEREG
jgi:hypothetical protein